MAFQIEVINVNVENKGKYRQATVNHKTAEGKVDAKKLVNFAYKPVFDLLSQAQPGDQFEITAKKVPNEKGGEYWQWVEAISTGKNTGSSLGVVGGNKAPVGLRNSYETPEERAQRQVYIIRQSSIANAIAFFDGSKAKPDIDSVLSVADHFVDYVLNGAEEKPVEVE